MTGDFPYRGRAGIMPINIRCRCSPKVLKVPDEAAGRRVRCPSCKSVLAVPGAATARPSPPPTRRGSWVWVAAIAGVLLIVTGVSVVVGMAFLAQPGPVAAGPTTPEPTRPTPSPIHRGPTSPAPTRPTPIHTDPPEPPKPQPEPPKPEPPKPEPPTPSPPPNIPKDGAVGALNRHRALAGLPPVEVDPNLSAGCQAHADYLAKNIRQVGKGGFRMDREDNKFPGYSEEGNRAAEVSVYGWVEEQPGAGPGDVIGERMAALFFRMQLLEPRLRRVGWGESHVKGEGWFAVLDVRRGRGAGRIMMYPADGQKDVPLSFPGNEIPDPIPESKDKKAGYPVTVTFPHGVRVEKVVAKLTDDQDKEVPVWLSTPEKPVIDAGYQMNTVCLISKSPLTTKATYTVKVEAVVNGEPWTKSWQFTTGSDPKFAFRPYDGTSSEEMAKAILDRVNFFRKAAGVDPVEYDPVLTKGCQAHADYLAKNAKHPSIQGLGAHDERSDLPGFSAEGQRAGKASDISLGIDPLGSVDGYVSTFFHRIPLLDPELRRIGFGSSHEGELGWIAVLDVQTGRGGDHVIAYPSDGQKDVPLKYVSGERPDPIPESKDKEAGYPITLTFPPNAAVKNATAVLKTAAGQEVPAWVSTPEKSVDVRLQKNTVSVIAKQPLKAGTTYTVVVEATVEGKPWSKKWSFNTVEK